MTSELELEFSDKIEIVYSIINDCRIYRYKEIRYFRYSSETNVLVNHRTIIIVTQRMLFDSHLYHCTFRESNSIQCN